MNSWAASATSTSQNSAHVVINSLEPNYAVVRVSHGLIINDEEEEQRRSM